MFVFILLVVVAFGVFWEVLEFGLGELSARTGVSILARHGIQDTMLDGCSTPMVPSSLPSGGPPP
jgi:hypothetical protein